MREYIFCKTQATKVSRKCAITPLNKDTSMKYNYINSWRKFFNTKLVLWINHLSLTECSFKALHYIADYT